MIRDTLLIIDDSELDLAILNEIFKGLFRVECAAEARRGLTYLHHNMERVCAVLLDICLERRGAGFTVLHQLQGNPDTASLPVILITTDANEKDVRASVERGAVDFLVKPVDPHTVQERVCSVVRAAWPPSPPFWTTNRSRKFKRPRNPGWSKYRYSPRACRWRAPSCSAGIGRTSWGLFTVSAPA